MRGFTTVELLIVLGAAILIAALTVPVGVGFFQSQTLDETTSDILAALRRAQNQAVSQKNDSAFGVEFLAGSYVLFQGSSYAARTVSEDETFSLSTGITTSGLTEVVFAKRTGLPSATTTLTVSFLNSNQTLTINDQGKIER